MPRLRPLAVLLSFRIFHVMTRLPAAVPYRLPIITFCDLTEGSARGSAFGMWYMVYGMGHVVVVLPLSAQPVVPRSLERWLTSYVRRVCGGRRAGGDSGVHMRVERHWLDVGLGSGQLGSGVTLVVVFLILAMLVAFAFAIAFEFGFACDVGDGALCVAPSR